MRKFHIKKGDEVVVIAGVEKGKRGKIIEMQRSAERAIVEGEEHDYQIGNCVWPYTATAFVRFVCGYYTQVCLGCRKLFQLPGRL